MTGSQDKTSKTTLLLVYLVGFCFLWEQSKRISFPSSSEILSWVRIAELILLGAVLLCLPYREHRWYFIMILAVILIFLTAWYRSPLILEKTKSYLNKAVLVCLLCPAVGILVQGRSLKSFLQILIAIWTITNVLLCLAGIYAVIRNTQIMSYNGKSIIGLNEYNCLVLWDSNSNTTGALLAISIIVAYIGAAITGKKWISVLYLVAISPMLYCLTMSNSRAGMISMWIGSGVALSMILQKSLNKHIHIKLLKWLISLLLVGMITVLGLMGMEQLKRSYKDTKLQGITIVSLARAEMETSSEPETIEEDPLGIQKKNYFDGYLSGREDIWRGAFEAIKMKPSLLLTGTSVTTVMEDLGDLVPRANMPQLHNEFLQILISTGIFGVLLFIAFLFFALRASFCLFTDIDRPLWERMMFLPFLCIFLIDQVEALRIGSQTDLNGLMMIFTGVAIVISERGKTCSDQRRLFFRNKGSVLWKKKSQTQRISTL